METWPAALQQKLNEDGFSYEFGDTILRSDMDTGLAKTRSRFTDGIDKLACTIDVEYDEWEDLYDFYKTTLNNGALTFGFVNPLTGDMDEWRFLSPPTLTPMGGLWFKVAMKWERIP